MSEEGALEERAGFGGIDEVVGIGVRAWDVG